MGNPWSPGRRAEVQSSALGFSRPISVALMVLASCAAMGDPAKDPQRWLGDQKVDLSPLLKWWPNRSGERPLAAWVHVTGSIIGTNTWGWILEARVEGFPNVGTSATTGKKSADKPFRIILKNPPLLELVEFDKLAAQQKALKAEREKLSSQEAEARDKIQELSAQQKANHQHHVPSPRSMSAETRKSRLVEKDAKAQIEHIDRQLKELTPRLAAVSDGEKYIVDCLALEGGQSFNGLAVYDRGLVVK